MSRLESYRQKQYKRKLTLFAVTLVVIIILIFTVGINLLIKGSVFFGELGGGRNQEVNNEAFFGSLDVDPPPIATNSAQILISGSITGYDTVILSINGKEVKTVKQATSFNEVIGDLKKGQNEIKVLARLNRKPQDTKKETFLVLYKSDKPKLDLSEPTDGSKTNNQDLKVAGKTDPDVTVQVNDAPVVVDVQGNFQTMVRLQEGDNKIKVVATDSAGNTESKELTVKYEKDS